MSQEYQEYYDYWEVDTPLNVQPQPVTIPRRRQPPPPAYDLVPEDQWIPPQQPVPYRPPQPQAAVLPTDPLAWQMISLLLIVGVLIVLFAVIAPRLRTNSGMGGLPEEVDVAGQMVMGDAAAQVAETVQQPAPTGQIATLFTPEVRYWESSIVNWANQFGLDPNLVATVMQIESCGYTDAVSSAGAQGLFQVMPFHFAEHENMLDPATNAARGMAYLAGGLAKSNGDAGLAMAGYNGGHGVIGRNWDTWPAETQRYFSWGTGIYADAQAGLAESPTLQRWLSVGGASLCQQAAAWQASN